MRHIIKLLVKYRRKHVQSGGNQSGGLRELEGHYVDNIFVEEKFFFYIILFL